MEKNCILYKHIFVYMMCVYIYIYEEFKFKWQEENIHMQISSYSINTVCGLKKIVNQSHLSFTFVRGYFFFKSLLSLLQYCFCFCVLFFWPQGMWDLSSLTRD